MIVFRLYTATITLVVFLSIFFGSQEAFAHTLKVDGQTGITLHIEPDDEPVAGEASKFLISVQDKTGMFSGNAALCMCVIEVRKDDLTVDTLEFSVDSEGSTTIDYTFMNSGIHKVNINGRPTVGAGFEPFDVTFSYRVKGVVNPTGNTSAVEPIIQNELQRYTPFVVIGTAVFVVILYLAPSKKTNQAAKR